MTLGLSVQYGMLISLFMARHERFNRFVRDFVDEAGTLAVGIAERDGEFDHRERRFTSTDDVGVTVNGGNDESKVLFQRQQVLRGELQFRRVRAVAAVVLRDTLADADTKLHCNAKPMWKPLAGLSGRSQWCDASASQRQ